MQRLPPKVVREFTELVIESGAGWRNDRLVLEFVRDSIKPPGTFPFSDLRVRQVIADAALCIDMSGVGWAEDRRVIAELWLLLGPRPIIPEPAQDDDGFDVCPQCSRVFHPVDSTCPARVFGELPSA